MEVVRLGLSSHMMSGRLTVIRSRETRHCWIRVW